ncbi:MAG TPA: ABC transporter permease, partial [bacterium]|nr:ABC transporter permease [bacterium]
ILLPAVYLFGGVRLSWTILLLPLVVAIQVLLALGLSFFVAMGNVFFRDLSILMEVILMGWFYMTPVFYPLRYAWDKMQPHPVILNLYLANPMTPIIYAYRRVLLHSVPQAERFPLPLSDGQAAKYLLFSLAFSLIVFILGFLFFKRCQRYVEDYL